MRFQSKVRVITVFLAIFADNCNHFPWSELLTKRNLIDKSEACFCLVSYIKAHIKTPQIMASHYIKF